MHFVSSRLTSKRLDKNEAVFFFVCVCDETRRSDVTLGLRYTGLMRSASVGGVCVCEREDGLQMAGRRRRFMDERWLGGGSTWDRATETGAVFWVFFFLVMDGCCLRVALQLKFFLCLRTDRLGLMGERSGWLAVKHTLGRDVTTDLSSFCVTKRGKGEALRWRTSRCLREGLKQGNPLPPRPHDHLSVAALALI